ncbi:MAG: hypothetical protein JO366_12090, partial [Methylobacteriaceae bacterium]|nr:hypothetical protein [Methylobacteriaceae bacterium]
MSTEAIAPPRPAPPLRALLRPVVGPLVAIVIATLVGAALVAALGQNPIEVYSTLIEGGIVG